MVFESGERSKPAASWSEIFSAFPPSIGVHRVPVNHPAAIGRANRRLIHLAVGKLFEVPTRCVRAPDVQHSIPFANRAGKNHIAAIGTGGRSADDDSGVLSQSSLTTRFWIEQVKICTRVHDNLGIARPTKSINGRARSDLPGLAASRSCGWHCEE